MRLAVVWGGRDKVEKSDQNPLKHTQKSVDKFIETLRDNQWECEEVTSNTLENYGTWLKDLSLDKDVSEFLFIFTGHGVYGNSKSQVPFQVCLETHKAIFSQIISETVNAFSKKPEKMAFVIDSCYSGDALTERYNDKNFEVLTSTSGTKAYEDDTFECSVFAHYFCEIFKSETEKDTIDLEQISTFASKDKRQFALHSKALTKEKIVIGYNKEIQEIKQALKNIYPKIEDFKKAILSYLREDVLNFDKIVDADTYLKLFQKLLEEKECLYCLLKELGLHEKYLSRVKKVDDCSKYKEEIAKKRSVASIILVIRKSTNDGLDDCTITCHEEKSDGKYNISVRSLSNVNFTNRESYEEAINSLVSYRVNSENILELKLILPEDFFEVDFCTLQIETAFGRKKKLKEVFQISKKILMRFNDYKTVGYFERWKKNQTKYNGLKTEPIEKYIFLVDEENKVSLYGVDIIVEDKNEPDYLAVHSFYPLVKKDYIVDMVEYGVPIVMSATKKIEEFSLAWKKSSVCNMKSVLFKNLRYYENRQLIHDNYDEVVWLQEAIEQEKKRS